MIRTNLNYLIHRALASPSSIAMTKIKSLNNKRINLVKSSRTSKEKVAICLDYFSVLMHKIELLDKKELELFETKIQDLTIKSNDKHLNEFLSSIASYLQKEISLSSC